MSKELLREEVDTRFKWDLSRIYKSQNEIDEDIKQVKELVAELVLYKGKIMESSDSLYETISKYFKLSRIIDKLVVYANMKYHEDMSIAKNQVLVEKIDKLSNQISEQIAFIEPELLSYDYSKIEKYINENPLLMEYSFSLENTFRQKPYILDTKSEEMMARLGEVFNNSENTFDMLDTVDLEFKDVTDKDGVSHSLNQSNYSLFIRSSDRVLRKNAFDSYYEAYLKHKNTFASTLYGNIKTNFFIANTRGYKNPLFMSLYSDNISEDLYNKLISKVNDNLDIFHEYIALRKKVLQIDDLHMYDIYAPLVKDMDKKYTYEEALSLVKEALSILGEDYLNNLNEIIDNGAIDVYHNKNKRTGAYSWGSYDTLPYVLLNFEGNFNDVSTIAHELGHSMHSYYSKKNNSYQESSYTIFLAEIASTVNEILLNKYCSDHAQTKEEKRFYLNNLLENLRTTLIRQTMFAEFEKKLYDLEEQGEILTEELISNTYYNLNKKYYGDNIISDEEIRLEWARISHFYSSFYVYKYATGISVALKIADDILNKRENALENYFKFLSAGESDYSLNILKNVGIDIVNDDTIDKALELFSKTIKEFKESL